VGGHEVIHSWGHELMFILCQFLKIEADLRTWLETTARNSAPGASFIYLFTNCIPKSI
jgi:hypothetical protein